ncbi:transcriptional regulator, AraC family [Parafrankia sp. EAN1pec]|nr:transcriptional regulator, AraC family [Frankia sp. EAN1pec]
MTGLLDGRPAATHWNHAATFSREFPAVRLDSDVLFVDDGDVLTSAGAASGVDLCLHLIRLDQGSEVANAVARACIVAPWREGGQAQFIEAPVPDSGDASTAATREWALRRLDAGLTLASMARHASMSIRTFTRRFRDETGTSPNQWLTRQRIDYARRLLESTDLSIDQIADATGFGTAASLRGHLRNAIGVSPSAYRRTFHLRAHTGERTTTRSSASGEPGRGGDAVVLDDEPVGPQPDTEGTAAFRGAGARQIPSIS